MVKENMPDRPNDYDEFKNKVREDYKDKTIAEMEEELENLAKDLENLPLDSYQRRGKELAGKVLHELILEKRYDEMDGFKNPFA